MGGKGEGREGGHRESGRRLGGGRVGSDPGCAFPPEGAPGSETPRELIVRRPQDDDSSDMSDGGPYKNLLAQDKADMIAAFRAMESSDGSGAREASGAR